MALDTIGSASPTTITVYCVFSQTHPNALSLAQPPCALIRVQQHRATRLSQCPVHPPGPSSPLLPPTVSADLSVNECTCVAMWVTKHLCALCRFPIMCRFLCLPMILSIPAKWQLSIGANRQKCGEILAAHATHRAERCTSWRAGPDRTVESYCVSCVYADSSGRQPLKPLPLFYSTWGFPDCGRTVAVPSCPGR